jgi:uncharacterized protein (TIGR00255 family)
MRSMTGFGLGEATLGGGRVSAEVRSLNHRFLELRVRMPPELADQSSFVEQHCRERLGRGRYDVSVRVDAAALPSPEFDFERARAAYRALGRLRDELAPGAELPLSLLGAFPSLIAGGSTADPEPLRQALVQSLERALSNLEEMRGTEGKTLAAELSARLGEAVRLVDGIAAHGPELAEAQKRRLTQRLEKLLSEPRALDVTRLELEVALLADRSDITEELVRLRSHFQQFQSCLDERAPTGRKLDFLLQEVGREVNTIGAKCQDASLSHLVVSLKTEVERLREQVQNVE